MDLSNEKLIDIAQFAISRLDGAWFMAIAKEMGIDKAWEMDVAAWKQFSYVLGKRLKNDLIPDPVWPQSFIEAIDVLSKVLKIEEREVKVGEGIITVRAKDCEIQKAIATPTSSSPGTWTGTGILLLSTI